MFSLSSSLALAEDQNEIYYRVTHLETYRSPPDSLTAWQAFNADLLRLKNTSLSFKLDALGNGLGAAAANYWTSAKGNPQLDPKIAFDDYVWGRKSERSNCVTTHGIVMFQAARSLGLVPVTVLGPYLQPGNQGNHLWMTVYDPSSGTFNLVNYYQHSELPVDRSRSLNYQVMEAARLGQQQIGMTIGIQVGDQIQIFTKVGALLNEKVLEAKPGLAVHDLTDGSSVWVFREGDFVTARIQVPGESDLLWLGYDTHVGKLDYKLGLAHLENNTDQPSQDLSVVKLHYGTSRNLTPDLKIAVSTQYLEWQNLRAQEVGGTQITYETALEHRGGTRLQAAGQIFRGGTESNQMKFPLRFALSAQGHSSRGKLRVTDEAGWIRGNVSPIQGDTVSFGLTSSTTYSTRRWSFTSDINYLDQGQGYLATGLGASLEISYRPRKDDRVFIRWTNGNGPSSNPFNLKGYNMPDFRTNGSRAARPEIGISHRF